MFWNTTPVTRMIATGQERTAWLRVLKTINITSRLQQLPACPAMKNGNCLHLGIEATLLTCSYCQACGPFCGRETTPLDMTIFKKRAPVYGSKPQSATLITPQKADAIKGWLKAKPTWRMADSFFSAVRSRGYLAVIVDVLGVDKSAGQRVDDATFQLRRLSCFGDDKSKPCLMLVKTDKGSFCGACGCGSKQLARLDEASADGYTKLHYPKLDCPLSRPGFSNASASKPEFVGVPCVPPCQEFLEPHFTEGASIVLVGNGPSLASGELGKKIDSFDEVIRFNTYKTVGFENQVGAKTTIWATHTSGNGKFLKPDGPVTSWPKKMMLVHGKHPPYMPDFLYRVPLAFYNELRREIQEATSLTGEDKRRLLPTSGFIIAMWLLRVGTVGKLAVAGFDHFSKVKSHRHHYWNPQSYKKPKEHDGEAEALIFDGLVKAGKVEYLVQP